MPQTRSRVIQALAESVEPMSTTAVQRATGLEYRPAKRALEDWRSVGFVRSERAEMDTVTAPSAWSLEPEHAEFVRDTATAMVDKTIRVGR